MLRKLIAVGIVLPLTVVVIISSSSSEAASPSKVIELKYAHHNPPGGTAQKKMIEPWIQKVEHGTKGKVNFTIYPASALGSPPQQYDLVVKGIADMCWSPTGFNAGRFPMSEFSNLPCLGVTSSKAGSRIMWELQEKFKKEFEKEYAGVKLIQFSVAPPVALYTSKKAIRSYDDLKGLKLRAFGGPPTTFLNNAGASAVNMPIPDVYMSLQKGVIDGWAIDWVGFDDYKSYEVCKYAAEVGFYMPLLYTVMNINTWNSLPPDVRRIIQGVSGSTGVEYEANVWDSEAARLKEVNRGRGVEITNFSSAELKKWSDLAKPIWTKYAKQLDGKGLPGTAALNELMRLVQKYK
jgi:TRAP-type C4-dicarboxylate transport system substrate-binding protein